MAKMVKGKMQSIMKINVMHASKKNYIVLIIITVIIIVITKKENGNNDSDGNVTAEI